MDQAKMLCMFFAFNSIQIRRNKQLKNLHQPPVASASLPFTPTMIFLWILNPEQCLLQKDHGIIL